VQYLSWDERWLHLRAMGSMHSKTYMLRCFSASDYWINVKYGNIYDALNEYLGVSARVAASAPDAIFILHVYNGDYSCYCYWTGNKLELIGYIIRFCMCHEIVWTDSFTQDAMSAIARIGNPAPNTLLLMIAVANGMSLPAQVPLALAYSQLSMGNSVSPDECAICHNCNFRVVQITGCMHRYHGVCIRRWRAHCASYPVGSCPLCRCLFW